jgi:hypothetical protein
MRSLIYTVVYGADLYFDCLRYLLGSIAEFGKYRGTLAIVSDRHEDDVLHDVPFNLRDQVIYMYRSDLDLTSRYEVSDARFEQYSPIMYLDNDVIVDSDISGALYHISRVRPHICVTTEAELWGPLFTGKICDIVDERRIGNWFGLELLRSDPECAQEALPLVNSGIMGFTSLTEFTKAAKVVKELYCTHSDLAKWFTDQPFLNYALVKTRLGDYTALHGTCSFIGAGDRLPSSRRGFVHFSRARGYEKPLLMHSYLRHLRAGRVPATRRGAC